MREHPLVAFRDCEHCKLWLYNEKDGKILTRHGKDVPRGDVPTPCDNPQQGCAKGHYDNPKTLSPRNQLAYDYIKQGQAVNWAGMAVDGIVRRNAAIVAGIENDADKLEQYAVMSKLGGLAAINNMGANRGNR